MKQVRETKAGQSISAYIILNKQRHEVANVQIYYGDSGRVQVDIWNYGKYNKSMPEHKELQQVSAGGGGYDKVAAAMRGMIIDGNMLFDHCGQDDRTRRILQDYTDGKISEEQARAKAEKIGARLTNYDGKTNKYRSLFYNGGLDRLSDMGYKVIQAI